MRGKSTKLNFDKSHAVYKFLNEETEMCLLAKYPGHLSYNTGKQGYDLLTYDAKAFIVKIFGHFLVSIYTEVLENF